MKDLSEKVAIVTGGGQGVGFGIAMGLANAGANITLTGRDSKKLQLAAQKISKAGVEVLTVAGNVRQREHANEAVAATIERFGRLDVLVNNAQTIDGGYGTPLATLSDETIAAVLESGLLGTIYFMQASLPHLKVNGGSIINLGSRIGIFGEVNGGIYAATKEGIRGISRVAAREWGKYNIRVNVICPAALSESSIEFLDKNPEEAKMYRSQIALEYFGDPLADIAPVAVFLASAESRYLTGQTLNADGGQMML
jgi:NAD(P)-dependent dehydrogenase (short-subunit alcohol dehydrogenase family)